MLYHIKKDFQEINIVDILLCPGEQKFKIVGILRIANYIPVITILSV